MLGTKAPFAARGKLTIAIPNHRTFGSGPLLMRDSNWLCLDCSKDTFDEYYGVHNHLWRRVVSRSHRHRMLCLLCLERRLGRSLRLEDFKSVPENGHVAQFLAQWPKSENIVPAGDASECAEFDDSPMGWEDYGLIGRTMTGSPARVPGLPDYFYLERVGSP
jgi:hypothetical protein